MGLPGWLSENQPLLTGTCSLPAVLTSEPSTAGSVCPGSQELVCAEAELGPHRQAEPRMEREAPRGQGSRKQPCPPCPPSAPHADSAPLLPRPRALPPTSRVSPRLLLPAQPGASVHSRSPRPRARPTHGVVAGLSLPGSTPVRAWAEAEPQTTLVLLVQQDRSACV